MQEEVTNKTVALIVDGAKLTGQTFEKAVKKFLEEIQKSKQPKIYHGKQTLKQLAGQNAGLANIEISNQNIKAFTSVAKKYHVDFALKKDTSAEQPRYLVFFKSRDADAQGRLLCDCHKPGADGGRETGVFGAQAPGEGTPRPGAPGAWRTMSRSKKWQLE